MARPRIRQYLRHGLLPQLFAFEACVRLGGVTRAAEELALAQSTVSGLLRKLSDTIGEPVLRARGGRIELTAAGREVARLCEEILDSLGRFEAARGRLASGARLVPPLGAVHDSHH
jgi:DNA-binding transcriptional LysR family regulator